MAVAIPREAMTDDRGRAIDRPTDISAPGLVIPVDWAPVAGATDVEVTDATLTLDAATAEETFPDVPVTADGPHRIVVVPGDRSVKALGLDVALLAGQRLTLSLPSVGGGWDAPLFASAGVSNGAMAPASPEGASFGGGVFSLPRAVTAPRLRLSVVTGDKVTDFAPVAFSPGRVNLTTRTPPRNIRVLGPDNAAVWQTPALPPGSPQVDVDLKTPIEIALKKKIAAKAAPRATVTVAADAPGRAYVSSLRVHGAIVRIVSGIRSVTLDGIARPLPLPGPVAAEPPTSVVGDLTVRYNGLRILDEVSDVLPATLTAVAGVVVGAAAQVRTLPPDALHGVAPARVGIVGRSPQGGEVSIQFVRMFGSTAGEPIAPPAVLTLPQARAIDLYWADVPEGVTLDGPVGVRVRANRGTFFWVANGDQPLVRLAIHDPDPGGRLVAIGSDRLNVTSVVQDYPKRAFAVSSFAGSIPLAASDLFLTVDVADLTLRYAR